MYGRDTMISSVRLSIVKSSKVLDLNEVRLPAPSKYAATHNIFEGISIFL